MSTFWRIALAWMLALALPLQGHAAQRLLACAGAPMPAQAPAHAVKEQAGHPAHELPRGHATGHDISGAPDPGHAHAEAAPAPDDGQPAHAGSCSACASCCHAPALLPTLAPLAVMPPALPELPQVHQALERVWLGGLERPPRRPLA